VALTGVRIAEDPRFETDEPFLTARAFDLRLRILPLLRRRLVVDQVLIEAPVVNLIRDRGGRLNGDSLRPGRAPAAPPAAAAPPPAPEAAPAAVRPAFQLAALRLRHGVVRYHERATGRTLELTDVAAAARQPRFDAPVPVALRGRLETQNLRLDGIVSEGMLDLGGAQPGYEGSLRAGPGMLGPLPLERLEAHMRAVLPVLDLESATAALLDGTVTGKARLASEGPGAGLTVQVEGRGLDLARFPLQKDRPRPAGRLELHATLAGPPPGGPDFRTAATGEGRFEVVDGRIVGFALGRGLLDAVAPFLKVGHSERLRTRYPDLFGGDYLRFTRLGGSGRLAGGRIRSNDCVLAGTSYEMRGEGSLGLDGDVDAAVRLSTDAALTEDLLGDSRARAVLVDRQGVLTVPLRVQGPLSKPRISPDPSFLSTAARSLLEGSGLEGLAGDLLERLLGGQRKR
jgi:hypothetical protein